MTASGRLEGAPEAPRTPPEAPGAGPRADSVESLNDPEAHEYVRSTMHCEATQLMTAARSGDEEAFETLFRKLRGVALQAARSLVGSHADAQDMTQEAFLKAYRSRESYDPAQPSLPWFHRILRNTCFSHLRKRGGRRNVSLQVTGADGEPRALEVTDEAAPRPSDRLLEEERRAHFDEALERLSPRDREILVLRHHQELKYSEIATALEIPQGTVMSRLFHARKRLKAILTPRIEELLDAGDGPTSR